MTETEKAIEEAINSMYEVFRNFYGQMHELRAKERSKNDGWIPVEERLPEEAIIKTPEEAIDTIRANMPTSGYHMLCESLAMAIEALETRQPKEPVIRKGKYFEKYGCPKCSYIHIHKDGMNWFCGKHYKFCPVCGQAIRWHI